MKTVLPFIVALVLVCCAAHAQSSPDNTPKPQLTDSPATKSNPITPTQLQSLINLIKGERGVLAKIDIKLSSGLGLTRGEATINARGVCLQSTEGPDYEIYLLNAGKGFLITRIDLARKTRMFWLDSSLTAISGIETELSNEKPARVVVPVTPITEKQKLRELVNAELAVWAKIADKFPSSH